MSKFDSIEFTSDCPFDTAEVSDSDRRYVLTRAHTLYQNDEASEHELPVQLMKEGIDEDTAVLAAVCIAGLCHRDYDNLS